MHDVARLRFSSRTLGATIAFMQQIGSQIMRIFDAIARTLAGTRPPADSLRRDVGLVEKPAPRRKWWDYV
jgi:hypothetical protein